MSQSAHLKMKATADELQGLLSEVRALTNLGVTTRYTEELIEMTSHPASFGIVLSYAEENDGFLLTERRILGSARFLSDCFSNMAFPGFLELQNCVLALLRCLQPASPCVFCGAHFERFPALPTDENSRALAVLKILGLSLNELQNLPVLEGVFGVKFGVVDALTQPDQFAILYKYIGPVLGNGGLKIGGNQNFFDSASNQLKKLNELELRDLQPLFYDQVLVEKARGPDRDFAQFASEVGRQQCFEPFIALFHDVCRKRYAEVVRGYFLDADNAGASRNGSEPALKAGSAESVKQQTGTAGSAQDIPALIAALQSAELERLKSYGRVSQEMQRQDAPYMFQDFYQCSASRSQAPPAASTAQLLQAPPGIQAPPVLPAMQGMQVLQGVYKGPNHLGAYLSQLSYLAQSAQSAQKHFAGSPPLSSYAPGAPHGPQGFSYAQNMQAAQSDASRARLEQQGFPNPAAAAAAAPRNVPPQPPAAFRLWFYQKQPLAQLEIDSVQTFRNYLDAYGPTEYAVAEFERNCVAAHAQGAQIFDAVARAYAIALAQGRK